MSRPVWLVPVVVLAMATAVSGGIAARGYYQGHDQQTVDTQPAEADFDWGTPKGETTVVLSADAQAHPQHEQVLDVLQRYFNAINAKDYAGWVSTVAPARAQEKTAATFSAGYASTRDSDAYVYRISSTGDGTLQVLLRFASRQRPDQAPQGAHRGCLWWRAAYGLVSSGSGLLLDDEGTTALNQSC